MRILHKVDVWKEVAGAQLLYLSATAVSVRGYRLQPAHLVTAGSNCTYFNLVYMPALPRLQSSVPFVYTTRKLSNIAQ